MIRNHSYEEPEALAKGLAAAVADELSRAVAANGRAGLAVPGGTTPARFLKRLGAMDLPWDNIWVTLTDERWVPVTSERSNQRLLSETLFRGGAAAAGFVPLYGATAEPADSLSAIETALKTNVLPLDVAVLGMGTDGHTASLFPGADKLAEALSPDAPPVLPMIAPGADEPRITLTLPVLSNATRIALILTGQDKHDTLDHAMADGPVEDMPVRALLRAPGDVDVYYAP